MKVLFTCGGTAGQVLSFDTTAPISYSSSDLKVGRAM